MDRIKGMKVPGAGAAVMLVVGLSVLGGGVGMVRGEEAGKATAQAKEGKESLGPVYGLWDKAAGLDAATRAKVLEIYKAQEGAVRGNLDTMEQLRKGGKVDADAGRPSDAKAKQAEKVRLREEVAKIRSEYYVKAMALLTPEQQKKAIAAMAIQTCALGDVTLTAEQEKKAMEKFEASADVIVNPQKEIEHKRLRPVAERVCEEVLTADQKKWLAMPKAEKKAKIAEEEAKGKGKAQTAPAGE